MLFQTTFMKHLLMHCGSTVFRAATYKTSRWAVRLFVLAVKTNCGYQPVAIFICEDETLTSIYDAIQVARKEYYKWRRCWNPTQYDRLW